ncbi:TetR/AcrR family transcriptional regulator [Parendozoicomonas haliclonae]|uniref:HTH-type transcriptional regulator BetI n=1 Tax=Parendozoicomonas haliclonae TaxID=1960125 RepID=A0A1X7AR17_9GAMM|nr:TetR/AcrR family transcriptional regulator [Parendozoicomonas haliclonae]SMA50685.1 HTH-type transcriptional regulator BetI [Parendozoicomonas haliclonae]
MGRPSKKEERTEQVLQAFQRCVARYGLDGSTLERLAEESGLQRSLVRHFVGNRDDLVRLLAERVVSRSDAQWQELLQMLPKQQAVPVLISFLFDYDASDPELIQVVSSLCFASGQDAYLQEKMQAWTNRFIGDLATILKGDYPKASKKQRDAVAFGLASLYLNLDSLVSLALVSQYRASAKLAAESLVASLKA